MHFKSKLYFAVFLCFECSQQEKIKNNHKNNVLVIYHRSINGKSS